MTVIREGLASGRALWSPSCSLPRRRCHSSLPRQISLDLHAPAPGSLTVSIQLIYAEPGEPLMLCPLPPRLLCQHTADLPALRGDPLHHEQSPAAFPASPRRDRTDRVSPLLPSPYLSGSWLSSLTYVAQLSSLLAQKKTLSRGVVGPVALFQAPSYKPPPH